MSTGTLRRHYRQTAGAANTAPASSRPVAEQPQGNDETEALRAEVARLTGANASLIEQARHWKAEAVALGWEKPERENDGEKAAEGQDEGNQPEPPASDELPEPPARSAKTAEWVDYAEANPLDPPLDLTARPGLRDEIAAAYLHED